MINFNYTTKSVGFQSFLHFLHFKVLIFSKKSYPLQVFIALERGTFVSHIPVVAEVAAERLCLRADKPRVHDLGKIMVGFAEIRQQFTVAMLHRMLCDGTADEMKRKTLCAIVGIDFHFPCVRPLPFCLMLFQRLIIFHIDFFK